MQPPQFPESGRGAQAEQARPDTIINQQPTEPTLHSAPTEHAPQVEPTGIAPVELPMTPRTDRSLATGTRWLLGILGVIVLALLLGIFLLWSQQAAGPQIVPASQATPRLSPAAGAGGNSATTPTTVSAGGAQPGTVTTPSSLATPATTPAHTGTTPVTQPSQAPQPTQPVQQPTQATQPTQPAQPITTPTPSTP